VGLRKTQKFRTRPRPVTKIGDIFRAAQSMVSSQAVLSNCLNEFSQITFDSVYWPQPHYIGVCFCRRFPPFERFMDLEVQVAVDSLPEYLLLLMPKFEPPVTYSAATKIIYIGEAALVRHAMPFEEPVIGEPLGLWA
jgi:hypothetical protein